MERRPKHAIRRIHASRSQRIRDQTRSGTFSQNRKRSARHTAILKRGARVFEHGISETLAENIRIHLEMQILLGIARDSQESSAVVDYLSRECSKAFVSQRANAGTAKRCAATPGRALRYGEQSG